MLVLPSRTLRMTAALLAGAAAAAGAAVRAGQAPPAQPAPATLTVRADRPGTRVSPLLYGLFFEEINHAGDGGLYGELVRNRAFEDADTPQGWTLVQDGGAQGTIALDAEHPLNSATPHALRLEVRSAGSGRAGAANGGYWGIPARKGREYRLSLYARRGPEFRGPLLVSLES